MSWWKFIRNENRRHFQIEVAAYPRSAPPGRGISKAGPGLHPQGQVWRRRAITSYFFTADWLFLFCLIAVRKGPAWISPSSQANQMPDQPITAKLARFFPTPAAQKIPRWNFPQATGVLR